MDVVALAQHGVRQRRRHARHGLHADSRAEAVAPDRHGRLQLRRRRRRAAAPRGGRSKTPACPRDGNERSVSCSCPRSTTRTATCASSARPRSKSWSDEAMPLSQFLLNRVLAGKASGPAAEGRGAARCSTRSRCCRRCRATRCARRSASVRRPARRAVRRGGGACRRLRDRQRSAAPAPARKEPRRDGRTAASAPSLHPRTGRSACCSDHALCDDASSCSSRADARHGGRRRAGRAGRFLRARRAPLTTAGVMQHFAGAPLESAFLVKRR